MDSPVPVLVLDINNHQHLEPRLLSLSILSLRFEPLTTTRKKAGQEELPTKRYGSRSSDIVKGYQHSVFHGMNR